MQLSDLRETLLPRLARLLPILMIALFGTANAMFCATTIVPAVRLYDAAAQQRDTAAATLEAVEQESDETMMLRVLNRQLDSARAALTEAGDRLLTSAQADELIERLYWYADRAGVQVVSLQSQEAAPAAPAGRNNAPQATTAPVQQPYELRYLRLQVRGRLPDLLGYIIELREASSPAVLIEALDLAQNTTTASLTLSLTLYTSQFATGNMLTQLPPRVERVVTISSPVEAMVVAQPTATATLIPTLTATYLPSATIAPSATFAPTATFTITPTIAPTVAPSATPSEAIVRLASMEEPPVEILFQETFDRDPLYAWTLGSGWSLVGIAGGRALQAANGTGGSVILRYDALGDAVIQMRFLLESGSMRVQLRGSSAGSYTIEIGEANALTLYRAGVPIQTAVFPGRLVGTWRTLRFSAFSSILRLSIDDAEQMIAFDSLSLPPGDIAISNGGGVLYVDDVTVWTP
jgi:hypothetical protein